MYYVQNYDFSTWMSTSRCILPYEVLKYSVENFKFVGLKNFESKNRVKNLSLRRRKIKNQE